MKAAFAAIGDLVSRIKRPLAHPLTRHLDLDDPETTAKRKQIICSKPFLKRIYAEWYGLIAAAIPSGPEPVLELGSGAGFMSESVPGLITSDMLPSPGVRVVTDGRALPFASEVLRGVAMVDVLHHIPDVGRFFSEAARCVRPGGVITMVEPWVTRWSKLVYTHLHHEPFMADAVDWTFSSTGPLSGANGALPWIVLDRDRSRFERAFPQWRIQAIKPFMPLRYLLSGGVSMRTLQPGWSFGFWKVVERSLERLGINAAMFAFIVLRRVSQTRQTGIEH